MAENPVLQDGDGYYWEINTGEDSYSRIGSIVSTDGNPDKSITNGGSALAGYSPGINEVTVNLDGRELVFSEDTDFDDDVPFISAQRSVYVSDTQGFVRFVDTFTSTSDKPWTTDFSVSINNGVSGYYTKLSASSNGDVILDETDDWVVVEPNISLWDGYGLDATGMDDKSRYPYVVYVHSDGETEVNPNAYPFLPGIEFISVGDFKYNLSIDPGETISIIHFAAKAEDLNEAITKAEWLSTLPNEAIIGLSEQQLSQIVNFSLTSASLVDPEVPSISGTQSSLSLIVKEGVLGGDAVYLQDLIEVRNENDHVVQYAGVNFNFSEIDSLVMTVCRNGEFTDEFSNEISETFPEFEGISYSTALALIGQPNMEGTLLMVAGFDGNYVG